MTISTCYGCILMLLPVLLMTSSCKRQGEGDALDQSVHFIAVDGHVTLSFRSDQPLQCEVLVTNEIRQCEKAAGSTRTWHSHLGMLDPRHRHEAVLNITVEGGEHIQRTYTWHGTHSRPRYNYLFRLNKPLLTAETVRLGAGTSPPATSPQLGCRSGAAAGKIPKNIEEAFEITEMTTSGFGTASASYHKHNHRYVRLNYEDFERGQAWNFRYVLDNEEMLFALRSPALLGAVTVNSEHNVPLIDTLMGRLDEGKVTNSKPAEITWRIDNPTAEMLLNISVIGDDKGKRGECVADPKEGRMELNREFLQQLPAGKYTMLVQLRSTQRVNISGEHTALWLVDAYDWRHGVFEKL